MGILELFDNLDVVQLDVQVLIHALQRALELDVIFQLDGDLVVNQGFEETTGVRHDEAN